MLIMYKYQFENQIKIFLKEKKIFFENFSRGFWEKVGEKKVKILEKIMLGKIKRVFLA